MDKKKIILKKIIKKEESHHGGSWKVAYADFTTAMMAFFLLLWLLSMLDPVKKNAIADYFANFSLLQHNKKQQQDSLLSQSSIIPKMNDLTAEKQLKSIVEKSLAEDLKRHVIVDTKDSNTVRIQIVDLDKEPMFELGSSVLTDRAKQILKVVADNIRSDTTKIIVEGHTDSIPFKDGTMTNWELSTERALSAMHELVKNGINMHRIAKVAGYADTMLLMPEKPTDARNRRISILLVY